MLFAPLLSLVLDAVLGHRHTIEPQSTYGGFGLAGADVYRFYSRYRAKALHQATRERGYYLRFVDAHQALRRFHQHVFATVIAHDDHFIQCRTIPCHVRNGVLPLGMSVDDEQECHKDCNDLFHQYLSDYLWE